MNDVAGYIQRKTMLYQTGVEYGDYTMNFVQGCSHGCKFPCYAFMMKKRFGPVSYTHLDVYKRQPQLRPMTVIRLARSCESLVSRTRLMHSQAVLRAVSKPMV